MKKPKISPKKVMMAMMAKKAASSPRGMPPMGGSPMGAMGAMGAMGGMKKGGITKTMPSSKDMGSMGLKKGGAGKMMGPAGGSRDSKGPTRAVAGSSRLGIDKGQEDKPSGMKRGGSAKKMAMGGKAGCYARGGGVEAKGKTKGRMV